MYAPIFSKGFESFSLPYTIIYFLFVSLKFLLNFKMVTETHLKNPFFEIGRCFYFRPVIGCRENTQELTRHGGFWYDFTESQAASWKHFQCHNL